MKLSRTFPLAALALILFPLAGLAYLGTFTRMHSDDFCIAASLNRLGFWPSIVDWYNTWAGRFMYFISANLVAPSGPQGAGVFPVIVILFWFLILAWTIFPLIRRAGWPQPRVLALTGAGLLLWILFCSIPNIFQSIYWRDGQVNYTFPMIGLTFQIGLLLRVWLAPAWPTWRYAALAFLLAFVCGGFAEAFDAFQAGMIALGLLAVIFLARGKTRRRLLILVASALAGSIIAMVIVVIAPGNQVRRETLGAGAGLFRVITFSLRNTAVILGKFILWNPLWALLCGLIPFLAGWWFEPAPASPQKTRPSWTELWSQNWFRGLLLFPTGAFLAGVAACAPVVYIMNAYPEDRTILLPQAALVAGLAVAAALLGGGLRRGGWLLPAQSLLDRWVPALVLALLAVACAISLWATFSQIPTLQSYTAAWDRRDADMRQAHLQGQKDVTFFGLNNRAGIGDLTTDPTQWINRCTAEYYGFTTVTGK